MLNVEDGITLVAEVFEKELNVLIAGRIISRSPIRILESFLDVDQKQDWFHTTPCFLATSSKCIMTFLAQLRFSMYAPG